MSLKNAIDERLQRGVAAGDVPGVAVVITTRAGPVYEAAFGERVLGGGVPMSPDTVVWIASLTKAITGTAAMREVERGNLDLDAPAKEILPELGEVQVLEGFDADGKPKLRAPKRDVTLRHLLTHTAGFSYEIWNQDILAYQQATGTPMITTCENRALTTPLTFDPGEGWDYGINVDWAGKMVEKVSGQRLGAYLAENVFAPLGMASTGFRITEEMRSRMAKIHHRGEDGSLAPSDLEIEQNPEFEMGGGGLYGTVVDYAKFTRMILGDGEGENGRVLKPETVATMAENHAGSNRVRALEPAIPPLSNTAELFPGLPKSWGLTFMINEEDAPTGRPAGSLGWAGLANAYYWIDRKNGVSGVFATQILPFADVKALPLYLDIEKMVYDHLGEIA